MNVKILAQISFSLIFVLVVSVQVVAPAFAFQDDVLYGDCGYLQFEDVDDTLLTKEEKLGLLDDDFESALNRSEKCLKTAVENSNQELAQAGAENGSSGGGSDAAVTESSGEPKQEVNQSRQTEQTVESGESDPHQRGEQKSGSSAVCDAVTQGLQSASTASEREHFEKLAKQYQC